LVAKSRASKARVGNKALAGSEENESEKILPNIEDDPVFSVYGPPFLAAPGDKVCLNERAVAVKCASDHLVRYNPTLKIYERYNACQGLWLTIHEVEVRRLFGDLLLKLGAAWDAVHFTQSLKNSQFNSLSKMIQPYQVDVASEETTGLLHVANGVLDLRGAKPKLLSHDAKYPFRVSSLINYDLAAKCPRFVKELLTSALVEVDISLAQKYFGSMLLGPNTCHGMLVLRGAAGGGKSTLVTIVEKILGEGQVAQLRAKHLGGRFETSAFIGKRVLVGKDVPGDTLSEKGARLLKSLTGGLLNGLRKAINRVTFAGRFIFIPVHFYALSCTRAKRENPLLADIK